MDEIKEFLQVWGAWLFSPDQISDQKSPESDGIVKLEENCRRRPHQHVVRVIKHNLRVLSLDLVERERDHHHEIESDFEPIQIKPARSNLVLSEGSRSMPSCFVEILKILFLVYFVAKFSVIVVFKIKYDTKANAWAKEIGGQLCGAAMLHNDTEMMDGDLVSLNRYRRILDLAGDPFISVPGGPITFYTFCFASVIIMLASSRISTRNGDIRLDFLRFLLKPTAHIGQMQLERHQIVTLLLKRFNQFEVDLHRESDQISGGSCENKFTRYNYAGLLLKIDQLDLVRPANLSWHWHKILTFLIGKADGFLKLVAVSVMCFVVWCLFLLELYLRASQRANQFKCLGDNSHLIRPRIALPALDQVEHEELYRRTDTGSLLNLVYLGLVVELRYLSRLQLAGMVELNVVAYLSAVSFSFLILLLVTSILDKLAWLNQIVRQLEECVASLSHQDPNDDQDEGPNNLVIEKLTVTYVNHLLFMWHFASFKTSINRFLLTPVALVTCTLIGSNSLVAFNTDSNQLVGQLILYGVVVLILLLQYILLVPCMLVGRIKLQMKLISRVTAHIELHPRRNSLGMSFLKQKWTEQLLDDKSLFQMLAQQLFGTQVTSENLTKLTSYLVAWFLFLYREV